MKKLELDGLAPESAQQLWDSNLEELAENYRPLTDVEQGELERLRRQELVERIDSPVWLEFRRCWAELVDVLYRYTTADDRMDGERTSVDWAEIIPHWPCTTGPEV